MTIKSELLFLCVLIFMHEIFMHENAFGNEARLQKNVSNRSTTSQDVSESLEEDFKNIHNIHNKTFSFTCEKLNLTDFINEMRTLREKSNSNQFLGDRMTSYRPIPRWNENSNDFNALSMEFENKEELRFSFNQMIFNGNVDKNTKNLPSPQKVNLALKGIIRGQTLFMKKEIYFAALNSVLPNIVSTKEEQDEILKKIEKIVSSDSYSDSDGIDVGQVTRLSANEYQFSFNLMNPIDKNISYTEKISRSIYITYKTSLRFEQTRVKKDIYLVENKNTQKMITPLAQQDTMLECRKRVVKEVLPLFSE